MKWSAGLSSQPEKNIQYSCKKVRQMGQLTEQHEDTKAGDEGVQER